MDYRTFLCSCEACYEEGTVDFFLKFWVWDCSRPCGNSYGDLALTPITQLNLRIEHVIAFYLTLDSKCSTSLSSHLVIINIRVEMRFCAVLTGSALLVKPSVISASTES